MPNWWFSPGGRTRRPNQKLAVPGDVSLLSGDERQRLVGWAALRAVYVVLLVGLVWVTGYALTAPELRVESLRVVGNRLVPTEQVLAAAGVAGQNVFLLGSHQAERAVLTVKPIQSARMVFIWPNAATLEVVERKPFAVWQTAGASYLVSQEGIVLAPATGETQFPVISDDDARPVAVGDLVDAEVLAQAADLATALKPIGLGVGVFEYSRSYGLIVPDLNGVRVAFGRDEDLPEKVAMLRTLLDTLATRQTPVQFIDLRIKDRPYFR